jgi:hypothetical protein
MKGQLISLFAANICLIILTGSAADAQQRTMQNCLINYGNGIGCQIQKAGNFPFDCGYNNRTIACSGLRDNKIKWSDGVTTIFVEYRKLDAQEARALQKRHGKIFRNVYIDSLNGKWHQEVTGNGNSTLINLWNGNEIYLPLRARCQPPLVGEVGYCRAHR